MIPLLAFGVPSQSASFGRARDRWIEWLLTSHPMTAALLTQIGWFPTKRRAQRRLRRLCARHRIRLVGTLARGSGRPEHVYCRWRVRPADLLHEVQLTEVCLRLDAATLLRGPQVTDRERRPDAEAWINGQRFAIELDRGTTGITRLTQERLSRYEGFPHLVLWICPTPARRDALRLRAERLRGCALFTTFAEALHSPHELIWLDFSGTRTALPRQQRAPEDGSNPHVPETSR